MSDAISNIGKASEAHPDIQKGNKNNEDAGKDFITNNVRIWVIIPLLFFHVVGLGALIYFAAVFLDPSRAIEASQWTWPALIAAFAGLPFAFATNARTLVSALGGGN